MLEQFYRVVDSCELSEDGAGVEKGGLGVSAASPQLFLLSFCPDRHQGGFPSHWLRMSVTWISSDSKGADYRDGAVGENGGQ